MVGCWGERTEGEFINEFVVGGAKSHCYKKNTGETVIKQKGITMDVANSEIITFETRRDMVLNNAIIKSEDRYTFNWEPKSNDIVTKFIGRSIRSTVSSKRTIDGFDTRPFGYEPEGSKH